MKRFLGALIVLVFIAACDDSDDNNSKSNEARIAEVQAMAGNGAWRVTSYSQDGVDQTAKFNGYLFEFDSGTVLTATNGTSNNLGSWSVTSDDSNDDNPNDDFDDIDFNIAFISPQDFVG